MDVGNSSAKAYGCGIEGAAGMACLGLLELEDWSALGALPAPRAVLVSSVAGDELTAAWTTRLGGLWPAQPELLVNPDSGLELRIKHPETVGADRLFAARGALARLGRSAIVVDAGTALTVDVLLVEGGRGIFLGGAIAPGPALLAQALGRGGARLHEINPQPGAPALGRETAAALEAGVVVGFEGAALELVRRVAAEAQLEAAPVLLAGGAAVFLREVLERTGGELLEAETLVAEGLAAAWSDRCARP
ncbi:MAG: pantothenate kinase type III [Planctomycetota bacterium]